MPDYAQRGADYLDGLYKEVELTCASGLAPERVRWLWPGWLPAGKLVILGGASGTGKTTLGMSLAATLTAGGRWPDGGQSPTSDVVIWSGEDDAADTLIPRLALAGANLERVHFVSGVIDGNERRCFDPAQDVEPLARRLALMRHVGLLVVDPVVAAVAADSHRNAEVRRGLQPLVDLAARQGCALLGITHLTKGTAGRDPVERITGSLAFGALARLVLIAAKNQSEGGRLLCRAKSNLGQDGGGFSYELEQGELAAYPGIWASGVSWGQALEGDARALLAAADAIDDGEGGSLADAKGFLIGLLEDGPVPTTQVRADAEGAGYAWATIRRAQKALAHLCHFPGQERPESVDFRGPA